MNTASVIRLPTLDGHRFVVAPRLLAALLAIVFLGLGWVFLAHQHAALWSRVPASALNRFVPDQLSVPLPVLPSASELARACANPPSAWAVWPRSSLRKDLANCLADPAAPAKGANAEAAVAHYETILKAQVTSANDWLAAFAAQSPHIQGKLASELALLQAEPGGALSLLVRLGQSMASAAGIDVPMATRQPVGRAETLDGVAAALRARVRAAESRLQALASLPLPDRLRGLALLSTGLQLETDFGQSPPAVYLGTDRSSLADALEWQRRAHGFAARGFSLGELHALPAALLASATLLMATVLVAGGARWLPLVLWGLTSLLLGAGALVLTDLALTGDSSLRYLAERQFVRFGVGDSSVPLVLNIPLGNDSSMTLWWPMLLVALGVAMTAMLRDGQSKWLAPVRAWVAAGSSPRMSMLPMVVLLLVGAAAVLMLGMPAAVSELLILLGVIGLATYLARQAPLANMGAGLQVQNLGVVVVALICALGGALWRGDLGHALVALALACTFAWMFGWTWLRWSVALLAVTAVVVLGACLVEGALVGPLAWLTDNVLPPHAQDRMKALFDPFHVAASDLARVRWLIDSAAASGWGPGYVPWHGLAAAREQDGLPLQGPSDYVLALVSALWGRVGGLALMAAVLTLFAAGAIVGLRTALRLAMPMAIRWLAALGGFGCLVMAFKVLLSFGGVSGVLPLTGLPVALIGYGPVTHLAALFYLVLALGGCSIGPVESRRGVNLTPVIAPAGAARSRALGLALAGAAALGLLLVMGERHLRQGVGEQGTRHVSKARLQLAQALTSAMVVQVSSTEVAKLPCEEMSNAVGAWNARLANLARPVRLINSADELVVNSLRLDAAVLLSALPVQDHNACRRLARTLGQMLATDFSRLVGSQQAAATAGPSPGANDAERLSVFDKPRALGARPLDYTTANAWWGQPGCLTAAAHASREDCSALAAGATGQISLASLNADWLTDIWLQRELAPQLHTAMRQPTGRHMVNHREVATGPKLGLTLDGKIQPLAQRLVDCFTGRLAGADCEAVLPRDPAWRRNYFEVAGALRAGAMGLVLVEVETGRVVALAGSISDCSLDYLGRFAKTDKQGELPALRASSPCAQLPDRSTAWLALQHPALWMLPPGSSLKELTLVAGIDAGLVRASSDEYWKHILAESHERLPVQRTALASGQRFLDVLSQVGFGSRLLDLMWGGAAVKTADSHLKARWATEAFAGTQDLRATNMSLDEAERIRHEKQAGANVDLRYGQAVMTEFVAARKLADAALGGGDIRVNALGLASIWRSLDLRASGRVEAPAPHLVVRTGYAVASQSLAWASPQAAQRVLGMTGGITSSAWRGTAQGSCRVVFGACPAQGLPGLSGKTGSSDFLSEEQGAYVKPGQQVPAKLFGGVFSGPDGKRYAVAATALRVRQGSSRTLELSSSAPAEAALTLMREMGVRADN